jgi:hypothetical protein
MKFWGSSHSKRVFMVFSDGWCMTFAPPANQVNEAPGA